MFDALELVDTCRTAAEVDVRACTDDDLLAAVTLLQGSIRALEAAHAAAVGELDARAVTARRFGHGTKEWLAAGQGTDAREAGRWCRVGRGLRSLDLVAAALADGTLTLEHARVLVDASNPRVAQVIEAAQAELIARAGTMRFEAWARHVRALVDLADADGGHDPRPERRSLTWGRGMDGELHARLTLVGAAAAAFEHLVETTADRLYRQAVQDQRTAPADLPAPSRAQLRADALTDLVGAGHSALTGGTATRPAADVTMTIPHDHPALTGGRGPAVACGATDLVGSELDLVLCDALLTGVVLDDDGCPLAVGRAHRFPTPEQRRALHVRDGGCAFPGCDAPPRWCDAHHVIPWDPDGLTDPDNLLLLCRRHHGVVHRNGWSVRHAGDQRFTITTAAGQQLTAQRHGRPPPDRC